MIRSHVVLAVLCFMTCGTNVSRPLEIAPTAVEKAKESIAYELRSNRLVRYSLVVAGGAAVLFVAWKMVSGYVQSKESFFPVDIHTYPTLGSYEWFTRILTLTRDSLITAAFSKGLINSSESWLQKLFHQQDITWFIKTHTNLVQTLTELRQFSAIVDNKIQYQQHEAAYAQEALHMSFESLVAQVERVMGFMHYVVEISDVDVRQKDLVLHVPEHVGRLCNALLSMYSSDRDHASSSLQQAIITFEAELTSAMARFAHMQEDLQWINA